MFFDSPSLHLSKRLNQSGLYNFSVDIQKTDRSRTNNRSHVRGIRINVSCMSEGGVWVNEQQYDSVETLVGTFDQS